jgi:hypothetical protein
MPRWLREAICFSVLMFLGWCSISIGAVPTRSRVPIRDCRDLPTLLGHMSSGAEDLFLTVQRQVEAYGEGIKREIPDDLRIQLSGQSKEAAKLFLRETVALSYDSWFFFHQVMIAMELFAKVFNPIGHKVVEPPNVRTVLILGVGTGIDVEALRGVLPMKGITRVVGVDYSEEMLKVAAYRMRRLRLQENVRFILRDLLHKPDFVTEERLLNHLFTTREYPQVDMILSMSVLGQFFDHSETVGIIRNWIAPYLKVGGMLGFGIASRDELAFPNIVFGESDLNDHPWVRALAIQGIELHRYVPVKGKTQEKFFLIFKRVRPGTGQRRVIEADMGDMKQIESGETRRELGVGRKQRRTARLLPEEILREHGREE